MPIDDGIGRENRRFDFEKSASIKKCSEPSQHFSPQTQIRPIGCGAKIGGYNIEVHKSSVFRFPFSVISLLTTDN